MFDLQNGPGLVYTVQANNTRFEVSAASGRTILVCEDEGSASHYASLLNEAYEAGYKTGYRDGCKLQKRK
jgi:hypothetical protein